ncbi:MAG: PSD1 and planctomycete cytochrome C domain-containing protein [Verrucomicrobiota bacterium]
MGFFADTLALRQNGGMPRFLGIAFSLSVGVSGVYGEADSPSFTRDIRPILSGKCFNCHGPDKATREAGFRLDRRESAIDADVLTPGDALDSWIMEVVSTDDMDLRMPPKGDALSDEEIDLLRRWIDAGAEYEAHWSYEDPEYGDRPDVENGSWATSELDYFVLDKLEEKGLSPAPKAKPAVLLRRLYLDLIGLPPSTEEVAAFEAAPSQESFEAHVDRLLQSPRYGEKWASGWLDLARYADSNGYQHDDLRTMWPYRDWVIDAFNDDMPFDQFTIEQLAGDLLPNPTRSQLIATGFNRNVPTNFAGGSKVDEVRANVLHDRVATTGAVWLGLTMECAQCHDHKFDEISQKEYFQFYAYFNKAAPEFEQQGDSMFRKHFIGRDVMVYATEADRKKGEEIEREIALEEAVIAKLGDSGGEIGESAGGEVTILDFEGPNPFKKHNSTRLVNTSLVEAAPGGGGKFAARVDAKPATETKTFWGTGYAIPATDLGDSTEITFWIKTDIASQFNLQVHTGRREASVFRFSTEDAALGEWIQIVAPLAEFEKPQWSIAAVNWSRVQKIQITAHGEDSYDGKYIMLDDAMGVTSSERSRRLKRVAELRVKLAAMQVPSMAMMDDPSPDQTHIMLRGDYTAPGDPVEVGVLGSIHPLDSYSPPNRLGLAQWLVDEANPLTPRVVVNRIWGEIFGRGIVSTPEDFGMQGEAPSHPRLLDWLAVRFVEDGWSKKRLLKTIVLSSTYQQSSKATYGKLEQDPENEWYSRGPRFRLPAELIRDNLLSVSGLLSDKIGGPMVYPVQPDGVWKEIPGADVRRYPTSTGEDRYRRGIYTVWRRGNPYPSMVNFDAPERSVCTTKRDRSNSPLQALTLLNDPVYVEMATVFAESIEGWSGSDREKIDRAFRTVVSRQPNEQEMKILIDLIQESGSWFAVAQTLLNLDETITKS